MTSVPPVDQSPVGEELFGPDGLAAGRASSEARSSCARVRTAEQICPLQAAASTPMAGTSPTARATRAPESGSTATRAPEDPARRPDQPVLRDGIRLRRLTRWQAEDMREDIADLAAESVAGTAGEAYHDRGDFLHRLAVTAHRPGFALLVAETTVLAGCAFGLPVGSDGSARRGFDGTLQEIIQRLASAHGSSSSLRSWPIRTLSTATSLAACNSVCSQTRTPPSGSPCCILPTRQDKPPSRSGAGRTWVRSSDCPAPSPPAC